MLYVTRRAFARFPVAPSPRAPDTALRRARPGRTVLPPCPPAGAPKSCGFVFRIAIETLPSTTSPSTHEASSASVLPDRTFQTHPEQLLGLDCELHRKL